MQVYSITPIITTGAYSDGDVIGGKLTLTRAAGLAGLLKHLTVIDKDGEGVRLDFFLFSVDPTNGTYTDNEAFSLHATDANSCIGVVSIATTDYFVAGADKVGTKSNLEVVIPRGISGEEDLFIVAVIRSATTFTAATDLVFKFGVA